MTNLVTDPYSVGLASNSSKSLVVDFKFSGDQAGLLESDSETQAGGPADMVLYELHIRDFSIFDQTVPEKDRGKYTAFTHIFSNGMMHLWDLAAAGLTHVHLLPAFDFTSVPDRSRSRSFRNSINDFRAGFERAASSDRRGERSGRVQLGL